MRIPGSHAVAAALHRLAPTRDGRVRWLAALRRGSRRFLLVVLVLIGVVCGLTTMLFHEALLASEHLLMDVAINRPPGPIRVLLMLLLPAAVGALLGALVPKLSPSAGGGLTLVRTAYARDPALLNLRAWLGTFGATPLSLGAGVPLGPEGPTVVLTAGVAAGIGRLLGLPARMVRGMLPVGAAAGIAAIFNTPITGVVFALEEVIGTASRGVLGGAIVAAVAAAVVHKQALGGEHLLPASPRAWGGAHELVGFAFVGLVAGLVAGLMPRVVPSIREAMHQSLAHWGKHAPAARGALAGLVVGCLGMLSPASLGVGYDSIALWLSGGGDAGSAAVAFVVKFAGMAVALAASMVGGVFAPSLFLGASLGAATGHLFKLLDPSSAIDPGAYALVGMGAFFAGFLRTPIASVLIVFELTGDYELVAPLMLAVALASIVAPRLSKYTLVERQLEEGGVSHSADAADPLAHRRVREAMTGDVFSIRADTSLAEARDASVAHAHQTLPVVDEAGLCLGLLPHDDLLELARDAPAAVVGDHLRKARVLATPDEPLDRVLLRLGAAGETRCPVVESLLRPRLVGFLAPSDFFRARVRASIEDAEIDFDALGG